jgi:alpha-1,4-digalacturonate transport system permease protein
VALERLPVAVDRAVALELFTLQLALNSFQGELQTEWNYLLAMTVITIIPVTLVFAFLQEHITTGIAASGVK